MKFRFFIALTLIALLSGLAVQPTAAQRPDAPPYAKRGPFVVGTRELSIPAAGKDQPALTVTVWYPALNPDNKPQSAQYGTDLRAVTGRAIRDAAPDIGKAAYPLIVYSHGLTDSRIGFVTYTEHLASHGFFVMAADHPGSTDFNLNGIIDSFARRPLEIFRQIDFAAELSAVGGPFAGMIDTNTVGVGGHSFGGYTTLAASGARIDFRAGPDRCKQNPFDILCFYLPKLPRLAELRGLNAVPEAVWPATTDPRIKAAAPMAPSNGAFFSAEGFAGVSIPLLIMVGSQDGAAPAPENATPMYNGASSANKALVIFEGAGHTIFVEKCSPARLAAGQFTNCSDLVWDMDRAHDLIKHFGTAFFLATLKGDADAARALTIDAVKFTGIQYQRQGNW